MRYFFVLTSLFVSISAFSQQICGTTEARLKWFQQHPELKAAYDQKQNQSAKANQDHFQPKSGKSMGQASTQAAALYTIPVVFHILHTGGAENITDAQVQDAMRILNEDFNAKNADTANAVHEFKNIIGNTQIEFRLATKDPQGNCTNGIIRHWDNRTNWIMVNFNDYVHTWNHTKYMNVYVVKSITGGNAAGYTWLPGSGVPASADCIVILSGYVGAIGTGMPMRSRALTHEVGHWLDLEHVWGGNNSAGVSCGDDGVFDTPITTGYLSCNLANANTCDPNVVENMQNYMDYAYCPVMYTQGQSYRMQQAITSPVEGRNNLSSTNNLVATGVTNPGTNCVPLLDIAAVPSATICSGIPLQLMSYTSNTTPSSIVWSSNGSGQISTPNSFSTNITFPSSGDFTVTCVASTAAGSITRNIPVHVLVGTPDITVDDPESFESSLLPSNWFPIGDGDVNHDWQVNFNARKTGSQCIMVPGEVLPAGTVEILETPAYDFKNNPDARFTFHYSYAKRTATSSDFFKVQASKNCGSTWTDIWVPSMNTVAKNTGGTVSAVFVPFNEWAFYFQHSGIRSLEFT